MSKPGTTWQTLWRSLTAVLWSFLGIRKRGALDEDAQQLNPVVVILTGLACAVLLVLGLLWFARWMVGHPV